MRELLCLLILAALPARGELFSFGVKVGAPLTDAIEAASRGTLSYTAKTRPFTIGPSFEVNLPFRTSIGIEALYRRVNYAGTQTLPSAYTSTVSGGDWSFPILIRHRLSSGVARPFFEAGFSFHRLASLKQAVTCVTVSSCPGTANDPAELLRHGTQGLVLGAGLELKVPILKIAPEVRYTRRRNSQLDSGNGLLKSNLNQMEFLLGISF